MSILKIDNLHVRYGSIVALSGISLEVDKGEIITLIGANGAGKSTTLKTVVGLVPAASGSIYYKDKDVTKVDTKAKVAEGLILSPEGRQIFPGFTVKENLMMGAYLRGKEEAPETMETVLTLFPRLRERLSQAGGTLSGGEQQMLAIARAMMSKPDLLLLDEPSLGLAPLVIKDIFQMVLRIHDMGTTILLVEQNARMALKISDRAYILETGKIVLEDSAASLLKSDLVRKTYLGEM